MPHCHCFCLGLGRAGPTHPHGLGVTSLVGEGELVLLSPRGVPERLCLSLVPLIGETEAATEEAEKASDGAGERTQESYPASASLIQQAPPASQSWGDNPGVLAPSPPSLL